MGGWKTASHERVEHPPLPAIPTKPPPTPGRYEREEMVLNYTHADHTMTQGPHLILNPARAEALQQAFVVWRMTNPMNPMR